MAQMLYVVGQHVGSIDQIEWEFVGVYDTEIAAVAVCTTPYHFVGPIELNATCPAEGLEWPGGYRPLANIKES